MMGARVTGLMCAIWLAGVIMWPASAQSKGAPPAAKQERRIEASGAVADIDEAHNAVVFSGGAKLVTPEGVITSRQIEAHLADANTIASAEARGDVKLKYHYTTKDGVERIMDAAADRAIYSSRDRTVQLVGNVTGVIKEPARQRTLDLASDEVTLWLDESRLRLRPGKLVFTEMVPKEPAPALPAPAPKQ